MKTDEYLALRFLPDGKPLKVGAKHTQPQLAKTLRTIATNGRPGFYQGAVMEDMLARLRSLGGLHEADDFLQQRCEYVDPISTVYRGYDVFECPPNGQGLAALMMMRALDGYDFSSGYSEADVIHLISEVAKMAYAARDGLFCDPKFSNIPVDYERNFSSGSTSKSS